MAAVRPTRHITSHRGIDAYVCIDAKMHVCMCIEACIHKEKRKRTDSRQPREWGNVESQYAPNYVNSKMNNISVHTTMVFENQRKKKFSIHNHEI